MTNDETRYTDIYLLGYHSIRKTKWLSR